MGHDQLPHHWYASAAEMYRAFTDMGRVWVAVGQASKRADVSAHGSSLLALAPQIYADLHASLNATVNASSSERCWQLSAERDGQSSFRGFSEMLFSGALTRQQADDIYTGAS